MLNIRFLHSILLSLSVPLAATTDVVSQHINACLLVTEAEVEIAIGTAVTAPEREAYPVPIAQGADRTIQWS